MPRKNQPHRKQIRRKSALARMEKSWEGKTMPRHIKTNKTDLEQAIAEGQN